MNIKVLFLLNVLVFGFLLVKQVNDYDVSKRNIILSQAKIINGSINVDRVTNLEANDLDYSNVDYLRLKEQLTNISNSIPGIRYIYLISKRNDKTVFLIDTQPKEFGVDGLATPGEEYKELDVDIEELLKKEGSRTTKSYTDKWGTFISALSSITDKNNKVVALVGIDVEVKTWQMGLWQSLIPIIILICMVALVEIILIFRQKTNDKNASRLAYLAAVLESSGDAIYSVDINEKILSWNVGAEKLYGYTSLEAINNMASEILIPKEKISEMKEDLLKVSQGKKMGYQERVRKNKKGELMTLSLIMSPVVDENNNLLSISVIARDITKQKQKDEELMKSNLELEKMNNLMIDRELAMIELKKKIKKYEITDK